MREVVTGEGRNFSREGFRVGGGLVQPLLNRVVFEGQAAPVQPKIMGVLVCLAGRAGEVVTREELLGTVWAGTHVTEHVLARAVSELRKLFGDRPQESRVIETIPKVGYRLVAPVSAAATPERGPEAPADADDFSHVQPPPQPSATPPPVAVPPQPAAQGFAPSSAHYQFALGVLSCAVLVLLLLLFLSGRGGGHFFRHLSH